MRVAVLTLTRDRLDYTTHCFGTLAANAGCDYDHFVLDQGSTDGTQEWLLDNEALDVTTLAENIGICRGLNLLLDESINAKDYDVLVRFDNDCEVLQPDTLATVAGLALEHEAILAPRVLGLLNPPAVIGAVPMADHWIDITGILGGIFMAIPARLFSEYGFRYNEANPLYTGDEAIVPWWQSQSPGNFCGYVQGFAVNHYETTLGQRERFPEYESRKLAEMAA